MKQNKLTVIIKQNLVKNLLLTIFQKKLKISLKKVVVN